MKTFGSIVAVSAAVLIAASSPIFAQDAAAGKAVYSKKCQSCHAADGNGNAAIGTAMKVTFKPLSSDDIQKMSDADLKKVVMSGSSSAKMKPVTGVMPADVDNVVAYLRTMKKK